MELLNLNIWHFGMYICNTDSRYMFLCKGSITVADKIIPLTAASTNRLCVAFQDVIQAQAKQALSGLNAEMWSSYMQFCEEEKEKENRCLPRNSR